MILILILATSHAGEAEEDDDIVSAQLEYKLLMETILKDFNPRIEVEKRAWNSGFYHGIGKRMWHNFNFQGGRMKTK